jgi:putative DNA primase/helicase
MSDFSHTGAFNVNGQWATSIKYEAQLNSGELEEVTVTFKNGRQDLARAKLDRDDALELLGNRNVKAIESAAGEQSAGSREQVKGELRGRRLEFRQISLTDDASRKPANTIALDGQAKEPDVKASDTVTNAVKDAPTHSAGDTPRPSTNTASAGPEFSVPDDIARRFLRVDNKYYFPDRSLAFVDRGTKLKIETENAEVVRLALDIAQARGWAKIRVTGTDSFRSKVWREASLRDVPVRGYEPTELERQDVERARNRRAGADTVPINSIQESQSKTPTGVESAEDKAPKARVIVGALMAHGAAPYKNDETQPSSYFITVEGEGRSRTLWGVGLEKAIRESVTQPQNGDRIGIQHVGMETVRVNVPIKDDAGVITGERAIDTHRNRWVVEKHAFFGASYENRLSEPARGPSSEETAKRLKESAAIQDNQPASVDARVNGSRHVAVVALGRVAQLFAEKYLSERDRQRFVDAVNREVSAREAQGGTIPEPRVRSREGREHSSELGR